MIYEVTEQFLGMFELEEDSLTVDSYVHDPICQYNGQMEG